MSNHNLSPHELPIEQLQLSLKALGSLKRSQILTISDLLDYTQEDLLILDAESGVEVIAALQAKLSITLPVE